MFQLKLYEDEHSKTQTFVSRLIALWRHVRQSRADFERTPDRGIESILHIIDFDLSLLIFRFSWQECATTIQSCLELYFQRLYWKRCNLCYLSSSLLSHSDWIFCLRCSITYLVD